MPQLIAMIIVVVGAMIYMFQTFGGTGDKIEGVAQKGSIITEINNIKDGLKIAARSEQIATTASGDRVNNLQGLAKLSYFAEQINNQLTDASHKQPNVYNAISFGGGVITQETLADTKGNMEISLVSNRAGMIPGIFVDFSKGNLGTNKAFLESQIANDLSAVAYIDRHATAALSPATGVQKSDGTDLEKRTPAYSTEVTTAGRETISDGKFIIYFKDFGSNEVVK